MIMLPPVSLTFCLILFGLNSIVQCKPKQPNILFILADDFGYNDVGYHGSQIQTPVIDKLAKDGVILENYYIQPICTPSRSQLLTGRYQLHTGLQHNVIAPCQPNCLPLDEVLLPEKLKEVGYSTHIVGKWHLGFYKKECMPTNRGFDSHYGYFTGSADYYTKQRCGTAKSTTSICGLDFHDNLKPDFSANTSYSTYQYEQKAIKIIKEHDKSKPLFLYLPFQSTHSPNQAPQKYLDMYKNINDENRKHHAAMSTAMDEAIGNIMVVLNQTGIAGETLTIFSTDNGGQTLYGGNNWPLRGRKYTLWEGGVRGVGFIHGYGIKHPARISKELVHISDWFPTILHIVGGNTKGTKPLDGFNVWDAISTDTSDSPRKEILHNIDPLFDAIPAYIKMKQYPNKYGINTIKGHSAIRTKRWKLLQGYPGFNKRVPEPTLYDAVYNDSSIQFKRSFSIYPSIQLFDVVADPTESNEVSKKYPDVVDTLLQKLKQYNDTAVPVRYPDQDLNCDPALHGGAWVPWA